jgi:hypothetical protein
MYAATTMRYFFTIIISLTFLWLGIPSFTDASTHPDGPTVKTWISDSSISGPHTYRFEFTLTKPASVRLRYGSTIHLEQEVTRDAKESHLILLKNLEPSTRYFYQFEFSDSNGTVNVLSGRSFKTPSSGPDVQEKAPMPRGYIPVSIGFSIPPPTFHQLDDWFFISYQFSRKRDIIPNIRNINITPTKTSARLSWETGDETYTPDVWYGYTPTNLQQWVDVSQGDRRNFSTILEGLRPATTYYFRIANYLNSSGGTSESRIFSFTTPSQDQSGSIQIGNASSPRIKRIVYALMYSRATLDITTDSNAKGVLEYGATRDFGTRLPATDGQKHSFVLVGLVPKTDYYAQLTLDNNDGDKSIMRFGIKALEENEQQKNLDLPVRPKPKILLVFKIDKKTITLGESTAIRWSTSDTRPEDPGVIRCSASGAWGGDKTISWGETAETVTPLSVGTYTYTMMCYKDDVLAITRSLVLTVKDKKPVKTMPASTPAPPQSSSILPPDSTTVTSPYATQNPSSPWQSASPPPLPPFGPPSGQGSPPQLWSGQTNGPFNQFQSQPSPFPGLPITISLSVTPAKTVAKGLPYTLRWEAQHAKTCTALGAWSGVKPVKGSKKFTADKTKKYYLFCEAPDKESKTASIEVTVKKSTATKKTQNAKTSTKKIKKK